MNGVLAVGISVLTLLLYGALLRRRFRAWRRHRDQRAIRELVIAIALFIVALGAAMSSGFSIAQIGDRALRGLLAGIAWALSATGRIGSADDGGTTPAWYRAGIRPTPHGPLLASGRTAR